MLVTLDFDEHENLEYVKIDFFFNGSFKILVTPDLKFQKAKTKIWSAPHFHMNFCKIKIWSK